MDDALAGQPTAQALLFRLSGTANILTLNNSGQAVLGGPDGSTGGVLRLLERSSSGTNFTGFRTANDQTADVTYVLPPTGATAAGQILTNDGSNNLTWATPATGGVCASTRKFVGFSTNPYDGNLDVSARSSPAESELGYVKADGKCSSYDLGALKSYVCTTEEIFQSIKCDLAGPIQQADNLTGWVNGGPPGYNASSNDCTGWTSDSDAEYVKGRVWAFDKDSGGIGYVSFCNTARKFACCR
jgi:hypothetical protein